MGLKLFSDDPPGRFGFCGLFRRRKPQPPNPDPQNFEIKEIMAVGSDAKIVLAHYPGCTTHHGLKLMLYMGWSEKQLRAAKTLDPHFLEGVTTSPIPVARFRPDDMGWNMAVSSARILNRDWDTKSR